MIRRNSSPTSVPGESAVSQVGDFSSGIASGGTPRQLKPFTTTSDQLLLLRHRGLAVPQEELARAILRREGYYRVSGYAHSFKAISENESVSPDSFHRGASFEHVVQLADFDTALRLLLLQGMATIEIAMRAALVDRLGRLDVEAHRNPKLFDRRFVTTSETACASPHEEWLKRFDALCTKSKEDFVTHHRVCYGGRLPIWAAAELLELGLLSRLVEGLQFRDAKVLAEQFEVGHPTVLKSWMHMFNVARNRAAHHARLWNRTTTKIPLLPSMASCPDLAFLHVDAHARTRLFGTLSCMRALIRTIAPQDDWHRQVKALLATFPDCPSLSLRSAGFPQDWKTLTLWLD